MFWIMALDRGNYVQTTTRLKMMTLFANKLDGTQKNWIFQLPFIMLNIKLE